MMRQKLALVVRESPCLALKRMNGFSPVTITRLGSAAVIWHLAPIRGQPSTTGAPAKSRSDRADPVNAAPAPSSVVFSSRSFSPSPLSADGAPRESHPLRNMVLAGGMGEIGFIVNLQRLHHTGDQE